MSRRSSRKCPTRCAFRTDCLSPRQSLVLQLLYDREMEVAEIAAMLAVDAQTVRSTHHKALVKLRAYFAPED